MLTEFPSIVVGITAFGVIIVYVTGSYSPLAGAIALSFMLIPIVARTTEESLKLVPNSVREASLALGVHKWRTTLSVVLPAAKQRINYRNSSCSCPNCRRNCTINFDNFRQQILSSKDSINQWMRFHLKFCLTLGSHLQLYKLRVGEQPLVLILMVLALNIGVRLASRGKLAR